MSTQNGMLQNQKVLLQSLMSCLLSEESRQIRKHVNKLCFLSDAGFSDLVSLKSDASIYVISQKTNTFFSN